MIKKKVLEEIFRSLVNKWRDLGVIVGEGKLSNPRFASRYNLKKNNFYPIL